MLPLTPRQEMNLWSYFYRETLLGLQVAMASGSLMLIPTCLVENKNEQPSVNQLVLKILYKISQPVVVVTIVGLYHTGKSHLMNHLAREKLGEWNPATEVSRSEILRDPSWISASCHSSRGTRRETPNFLLNTPNFNSHQQNCILNFFCHQSLLQCFLFQ